MKGTELYNTNSTIIKNIFYFLQNGDKQIKYSPNKDIVLLLGNTGSGKSTLAQYISGNAHRLLSREVEKDTGQYLIFDKQDKISSNSTVVSHTIYPDLVEDATTNTIYYDCPGFSDTRSAAHEIAATYFIKKVIDSASAVKMVFVVSHHSVTRGADRQDFILMLQHATDFIKQMDKLKNSIALVVTKIENRYIGDKLVSDEKVINTIGHYLEQAKKDIDEHPEMVTRAGNKSSDTKERVLSLLDIFLSKGGNGQYKKIGIFRKPNEAGLVSDIILMKQGRISLENLIHKNIQFVEAGHNDFGYTISAKSKVHISGLAEEINQTIVKQLHDIGKEVEEYCIVQEEKTSDLKVLISMFQNLREPFSKIQDNAIKDILTPQMFINEIFNNITHFKIAIPDDHIKTVQRERNYIEILNIFSNQSIKNHKASILAAGLLNLTEYLSDSYSFYRILNNMYEKLSEYDIQKNRKNYNNIHLNKLNDLIKFTIYKKIESIFKEHNSIEEMKFGKRKLILLNNVLDQTLNYQNELTSPEIDKIVMKGVNVQLSALSDRLTNNDIKFLEVYALHKVFIDTSLDLTGREIQITIVAPVWEVIGRQSIILDGKPGIDHNSQNARSGKEYGENGLDGLPGQPGGPAGSFIGIGKRYINEEHLHISANGGNGGNGQDGGEGADGFDGSQCLQPCRVSNNILFTIIYNKGDAEYSGQVGGNGGNGGIGGYGGPKGSINIINVGTESGMVQTNQSALDGHLGGDGKGGGGGKGGRYFTFKVRNYVGLINQEQFGPIDKWAKNGQSGKDGTNLQGRNNTWKLTKLINITDIKTKSSEYINNNIKNNLLQTLLTTFQKELNTLTTINPLITKRKKRNIKNSTGIPKSEEQLRNNNVHKHESTGIESHSYDQYVDKGKEKYHLNLYRHLNKSTNIKGPMSGDFFLETEKIKQTPFRPIFPMPAQLENTKGENQINLNDQYPSVNFHGNLLLSEMVLKKLTSKEIVSNHNYKDRSEKGASRGHGLAYRYYLGHR